MPAPVLSLAIARSVLEAVTFGCAAAVLHAVTGGRDPLALVSTALVCFGAALALVAVLRDTRAERQNVALTAGVIGIAVAGGLLQPADGTDALAVLTRIIGFGVLGEAFLWRSLGVARSITRWSDARTSAVLSGVGVGVAALVPGVEAVPLPVLALAAVAAAGLALSLARSTEELDLSGREARGLASGRTAAGSAVIIGALAVGAGVFAPSIQAIAAAGGDVAGPIIAQVLFWAALPFGYLAAFLVPLFSPLARLLFERAVPVPAAQDRVREQLMAEALEQTRPFVFGALELLLAMVAVLFAVVLVDRLTRERRSALADGATLERATAAGVGLGATIGMLLPRRRTGRRRPHDDGSPAAAIRLLYWRFLELAERSGAGWRAAAETPTEHWSRLRQQDARWAAALPIVAAFERVRYADEQPGGRIVEDARGAYRELASRGD